MIESTTPWTLQQARAVSKAAVFAKPSAIESRALPSLRSFATATPADRAGSAPSVAWLTFASANFALVSGHLQTFQSSRGVKRTFCSSCGSPLTYESDREPGTIDVTTVSLDNPGRFPPTREVWLEHKLGWEETNATLLHCARGSSAS